jgi:hypothetical protein
VMILTLLLGCVADTSLEERISALEDALAILSLGVMPNCDRLSYGLRLQASGSRIEFPEGNSPPMKS